MNQYTHRAQVREHEDESLRVLRLDNVDICFPHFIVGELTLVLTGDNLHSRAAEA